MKRLNELGGLRAFRVDAITFGPETDSDGNSIAHIAIPKNFLPIAMTGKIGALLIPSTESPTKNPTEIIKFSPNATWKGWNVNIGEHGYTTPELCINTDLTYDIVGVEGFTDIVYGEDEVEGSYATAKPDTPLYIIGVNTSLNQKN